MALMIARFCRFYPAYSVHRVMAMRAADFFLLHAAIPRLQAEEEARDITVAHSGEPQKRLQELIRRIKGDQDAPLTAAIVHRGEASYEEKPGEIAELRERQRQAAERIKQERKQWLEQQNKDQQELQP